MFKDLLLSLPENIYSRVIFLKADFVGTNISVVPLVNLVLGFLISLFFIIVSYLVGAKLKNLFFKNYSTNFDYLVSIALGYIVVSSGIGLLGMFSLFTKEVIYSYVIVLTIISVFPLKKSSTLLSKLYLSVKNCVLHLKKERLIFICLVLFLFLGLVNLINPEIREDQYHVDFPRIYLNNKTIMIPSKEEFQVSASPFLSEMYYSPGIFLWSVESARYIHFLFYILIILTLVELTKDQKHEFLKYSPLIFATAPVVIHEASSMYVDFQWLFCFLLSAVILTRNELNVKKVSLSAILFGGMLATKLWTIAFFPVPVIYLILFTKEKVSKLKLILFFIFFALITASIWYLRSYILMGTPFYPAFSSTNAITRSLNDYIGINYPILNPLSYINVFSPLFYIGALCLLINLRKNLKILINLNLVRYLILLLILYFVVHYPFGRYLLGIYPLLIIVASLGISNLIVYSRFFKFLVSLVIFILFSYYLINSLLILPYSFGIADKNKYLTRILKMDNSSYYDYGEKFDKYINKSDKVATYKIFGNYYANFNFIDYNFVVDKTNRDFNDLKKNNIFKLFIKGENIQYFCKKEKIKNCNSSKYRLISDYTEFPTYYLYAIR